MQAFALGRLGRREYLLPFGTFSAFAGKPKTAGQLRCRCILPGVLVSLYVVSLGIIPTPCRTGDVTPDIELPSLSIFVVTVGLAEKKDILQIFSACHSCRHVVTASEPQWLDLGRRGELSQASMCATSSVCSALSCQSQAEAAPRRYRNARLTLGHCRHASKLSIQVNRIAKSLGPSP